MFGASRKNWLGTGVGCMFVIWSSDDEVDHIVAAQTSSVVVKKVGEGERLVVNPLDCLEKQ